MHEKYRHLTIDTGNSTKYGPKESFVITPYTELSPKTAPVALNQPLLLTKQIFKTTHEMTKLKSERSSLHKKSIYTFGLPNKNVNSGMVYYSDLSDKQVLILLELLEQDSPVKSFAPILKTHFETSAKVQWDQFKQFPTANGLVEESNLIQISKIPTSTQVHIMRPK